MAQLNEDMYLRFKIEMDSALSPCVIHNIQIISGSLVVRHDFSMNTRRESHFYAPCLRDKEQFMSRYFTAQQDKSTLIIVPTSVFGKWDAAFGGTRCVRINKLSSVELINDSPEKLVLVSDAVLTKWQNLTLCADYVREYWPMLLVPQGLEFGDFYECIAHFTRADSAGALVSIGRQLVESLVKLMCVPCSPSAVSSPGRKTSFFVNIMRWLKLPTSFRFTNRQHKIHDTILRMIVRPSAQMDDKILSVPTMRLLLAMLEGRITNRYFDRVVFEPPLQSQLWRDFFYTEYTFSVSSTIYLPKRTDEFGGRLPQEYNYSRGEASMIKRDAIHTRLIDYVYFFKVNMPEIPLRKSFARRDEFETVHLNKTTFKSYRIHYVSLVKAPAQTAARKLLTPVGYLYDQVSQFDHLAAYEQAQNSILDRSSKNMCIVCLDSFSRNAIPEVDRMLTLCECKTIICRTCAIQLYKSGGAAKCPSCRQDLAVELSSGNPNTLDAQFKKLFDTKLLNKRNLLITTKMRVFDVIDMLETLDLAYKKCATTPVATELFMSILVDEAMAADPDLSHFENIVLVDLDNTSISMNDLPFNFIRHSCVRENKPAVYIFVPRFMAHRVSES